jgi:translation initiation factor IF-1
MIDANYIVGLTDGEGCFYVNLTERDKAKNPKAHVRAKSHFYIKLRADDLIVLEKVRERLGFGFIYFQKEKRKNHSACYRFEVNSNIEKLKLIEFFNKYPLHSPKKKRDFKIFSKVTKMIINKEHFSSKGVSIIRQLKLSMHH